MGFEQLAFSFAHLGLLITFTASQMASASLALVNVEKS